MVPKSILARGVHISGGMDHEAKNKPSDPAKPSGQFVPRDRPQRGANSLVMRLKNQLVAFHGRLTYVFTHEQEVGSIHFDEMRGEIFYKGHNIRHMRLEPWQWESLEALRQELRGHSKYHHYAIPYGEALDKIILESSRSGLK